MAWNLDDDGKFKNPISGHSATTFFLRRSIAIIREITGMELDYPEFGISCLNTTGIIAQHWDFIPSAKSHPDTVINLCVVMGIMEWVDSTRKNRPAGVPVTNPINRKKAEDLFPLVMQLVYELFPLFKQFSEAQSFVEGSFNHAIRYVEELDLQWKRGFREKMVCLLTLYPSIRQWTLNDKVMGKIASELNQLSEKPKN